MTEQLNAFEALALVPDWDEDRADIEELKGGLTNRVYHVRSGNRECVLRLNADHTGVLDLDRSTELPILEAAAAAGLGPRVLYADSETGILMTEYLHGRVWQDSDLELNENIEALAALLRRVHALPACGEKLDLAATAGKYEDYLQRRHGLHAFASICVGIIESIPLHGSFVCCHNDIVAPNIIDSGELKLIDWEYACDNDPMFDLASAIGFHNLDDDRRRILLDAYSGGGDGELNERLDEQLRAYDAIQWLWLATRHLISPHREQAARLEELQQRIR